MDFSDITHYASQGHLPVVPPFEHPKWVTFDQVSQWSGGPSTSTINRLMVLDQVMDISGSYPQHLMRDSAGQEFIVKWEFDDDERERDMRAKLFGSAVLVNPKLTYFFDGQLGIRMKDDDFDNIYQLFANPSMLMQKICTGIDSKLSDGSWNICNNSVCERPNSTRRCSGCKTVYYCNENCQRTGWKQPDGHKYICATLSALRQLRTRLGLLNSTPA
ncbi:hypothetical protein DL93DRAFT_1102930 [Clavulina sp. PMI_390]|nr:hypothetical protein DL93DRAFT_1102930 [Clavulina sp. PMI_390]